MRLPVQQRTEGVHRLDALRPDALLRPASVVDRVVRLHRGYDAESRDPVDVATAKVLGVLDSKPAVAGPVRPGHAVVDVEEQPIGPLPDGMHRYLKPGRVGRADPGSERVLRIDQHPGCGWIVAIRFIE